jgi:hypothetical protein
LENPRLDNLNLEPFKYRGHLKLLAPFQVEVFWVVMLCSVVVEYQHFRGPCCLHLQGEVASMGKNDKDIGPDWRGVAGDSNQQEAWNE